MSAPSESPIFDADDAHPERAGEAVDDGRGRFFPCEQCGADLEFSIGQQSLKCPFCGHVKQIELPEVEIRENDYVAALARLKTLRDQGGDEAEAVEGVHEIRCEGCGGNVVFQGTLTSTLCPYCGSPLQRDRVHNLQTRVRVDGVLPFLIPQERAAEVLKNWVRSLWFAPNDFKQEGVRGRFNGCYLPFYTFDSATFTRWSGQRGDHYWVEVKQGDKTVSERRTNWTSVAGNFQKLFDDVLVLALEDDRRALLKALEPWPLAKLQPFTLQVLAGFFAQTYDVPLEQGFERAKLHIEAAIHAEVVRRIGGDEQRVDGKKVSYSAITYKHLLLPVWLLAYQYRGKPYRVTINATTGEVQGERPYSWIKITLFVVMCAAIVLGVWALMQGGH